MTYARADFLNLAAAWKEVINWADLSPSMEADDIEARRRYFYAGAMAHSIAQRNIIKQHQGEAADILFKALKEELLSGCSFMVTEGLE